MFQSQALGGMGGVSLLLKSGDGYLHAFPYCTGSPAELTRGASR